MRTVERTRPYRGPHGRFLLLSLAFLIALLGLVIVAFYWTSVGSAQDELSTSTPPSAVDYDTYGRIEELSRSQDRFVQAILGIVALAGTGFLALIGLNTFQNSRNFERESATIREYAQSQIDRAVTGATAELNAAVTAEVRSTKEQIRTTFYDRTQALTGEVDKFKGQLAAQTEETTKLLGNFAEITSELLSLNAQQQHYLMRQSAEVLEKRAHAGILIKLCLTAFELGKLGEQGRSAKHIRHTALNHLARTLSMLNSDYEIPEQNDFWYQHKSQNWHLVNAVITALGSNADDEKFRQRLQPLIPASPNRLSPDAVEKLIAMKGRAD